MDVVASPMDNSSNAFSSGWDGRNSDPSTMGLFTNCFQKSLPRSFDDAGGGGNLGVALSADLFNAGSCPDMLSSWELTTYLNLKDGEITDLGPNCLSMADFIDPSLTAANSSYEEQDCQLLDSNSQMNLSAGFDDEGPAIAQNGFLSVSYNNMNTGMNSISKDPASFATLRTLLTSSTLPTSSAQQNGSHTSSLHQDDWDMHSDDYTNSHNSDDNVESVPKKTRFFWQYNIQSKRPKHDIPPQKPDPFGVHTEDPHTLKRPIDPVFNADVIKETDWMGVRVKHTGKARRGDGNDLTSNPKKLFQISLELNGLNSAIEALGSDLDHPNVKHPARREKNKLASRICRLKKKAQHEANKVKFHGLEKQHRELLKTLQQLRAAVVSKASSMLSGYQSQDSLVKLAAKVKKENLQTIVSGRSADFVNEQIKFIEDRHCQPIRHRA